eukprot:scaffold1484_cov173-Amphora_coffeaeformis.AAC.3
MIVATRHETSSHLSIAERHPIFDCFGKKSIIKDSTEIIITMTQADTSIGVEVSAEVSMIGDVAGVEVSAEGTVAPAVASSEPSVKTNTSIEEGRLAADEKKEELENLKPAMSELTSEPTYTPEAPATHLATSPPPPRPASPSIQTRECDYDRDPSPLYKAVEMKDWDRVLEFCEESPLHASTWVLRKEHDGQLRWRLLPLHAAIIFRAPYSVVDALLMCFPQSAMCKDDQGMLPLHLALRNLPIQFDIVEELLTAHPAAVYVQDRKGRTPLEGGLVATGGKDKNPELSVMELYTQIAAAGEKQRWRLAHDREAQQRMEAAQQQFAAEKEAMQEIHKNALLHANEQHVNEVVKLQEKIKELEETNRNLRDQKLEMEQQRTAGLLTAPAEDNETKQERRWRLQAENEALQEMVQLLLAQQASLRQALETQEEKAVEQEAARQKIWQDLMTQQRETRTTVRKSTTSWIEELKATETSIRMACDHLRKAAKGKSAKSASNGTHTKSKTSEPDPLTYDDDADLNTSLEVD